MKDEDFGRLDPKELLLKQNFNFYVETPNLKDSTGANLKADLVVHDVDRDGVFNWLTAHGAGYGFKRTVPSEAWHWEWWGGGPGGGPCGNSPWLEHSDFLLSEEIEKRDRKARCFAGSGLGNQNEILV